MAQGVGFFFGTAELLCGYETHSYTKLAFTSLSDNSIGLHRKCINT